MTVARFSLKTRTTQFSFHCIKWYFTVVSFKNIIKNITKSFFSNTAPSSMGKCEERKSSPAVSNILLKNCVFYQTKIYGTECMKRCFIKFELTLKILEEQNHLSDIWHRRNSLRIEKEKQAADSEGTSYQLTRRRSIRSPASQLLLPKKCLICIKVNFISKTRSREKRILSTDLRANQTFKMTSQEKTDERMMPDCSNELVAKKRAITGPAIKA